MTATKRICAENYISSPFIHYFITVVQKPGGTGSLKLICRIPARAKKKERNESSLCNARTSVVPFNAMSQLRPAPTQAFTCCPVPPLSL